jgi:hypothetical protein
MSASLSQYPNCPSTLPPKVTIREAIAWRYGNAHSGRMRHPKIQPVPSGTGRLNAAATSLTGFILVAVGNPGSQIPIARRLS